MAADQCLDVDAGLAASREPMKEKIWIALIEVAILRMGYGLLYPTLSRRWL
jgi:hypothetical protein